MTAAPPPSAATQAFDDARAVLHRLPIPDAAARPPTDWQPPTDGDRPRSSLGARPWTGPPLTHASPLLPRALTDAPTLQRARQQLARRELTVPDLVEMALAAAAADRHGAVVAIDEDAARRRARELQASRDRGESEGPLHGIPVTVKDVIHVAGFPTRAGSEIYRADPIEDGPAVSALRAAGALILGKVATHEFALGVTTPQCSNPYDDSRISGGSSGGSAIAVATGIGLASLGTDTRASLRVPAALCGVVGFKPTYGGVPATGIVPLSWTLDHLGPIAPTVDDAAIVLDVLMPGHGIAGAVDDPSGLVVGLAESALEEADPDVATAVLAAVTALERLGCKLVAVDVPEPDDLSLANAVGLLISRSEAASFHRAQGYDIEQCLPEVRDQLQAGLNIAAVDYLDAHRARARVARRSLAVFDECDVVAMPTTPVAAPPRGDYERYLMRLSRNTLVWGLAGVPALSLPCGFTSQGLPVGLQLTARPLSEPLLASLGRGLERSLAAGW